MTFAPVQVTAALRGPVSMGSQFGVALDGLLSSLTRSRAMSVEGMRGGAYDGGTRTADPAEVPLPLARCGTGPDWHWMATTALPVGPDGQPLPVEPHTDQRTVHFAQRPAERVARRIPREVPVRAGRYRSRLIPTVTYTCTALVWTCVGDPDAIRDLLTDAHSIGGVRGSGHGPVLDWDVQPQPGLDPTLAGHLHRTGHLGRPVPDRCLTLAPPMTTPSRALAGLRPPYWHPTRQHLLNIPAYPLEP